MKYRGEDDVVLVMYYMIALAIQSGVQSMDKKLHPTGCNYISLAQIRTYDTKVFILKVPS